MSSEAHDFGIKFIVDIVPNHTSSEHKWFKEALAAKPGSKERDRYMFRDGKGPNGELPPNNWEAVFGGPAWERVIEADGKPGQWYLHLFAVEQPDLNWENQEVKDHLEDVLKFWLDRGVDGFRIDVAHGMIKEAGLPDIKKDPAAEMLGTDHKPFWDQEGVHDIYRSWRKIFDSYPCNQIRHNHDHVVVMDTKEKSRSHQYQVTSSMEAVNEYLLHRRCHRHLNQQMSVDKSGR